MPCLPLIGGALTQAQWHLPGDGRREVKMTFSHALRQLELKLPFLSLEASW